jgi:hypothetical protein
MARRRIAAALLLCAAMGCKGKDNAAKTEASAGTLDKQCEEIAKACGDSPKHVEKIISECKQAAQKQAEKSCTDKASALYACYMKDVCGGGDKVWAIDDLRVLAERHGTCAAERTAIAACEK